MRLRLSPVTRDLRVSLSPTERAPDAEQSRWFADEVHSHDGQLKAYLHGSFPSVRDIDDVVQESYLRIWRARLSYPIRSTKSFLFQIARHLAIDLVRSGRVVTTESLVDLEAQPVLEERPDAAATLSSKEKIGLLSEALASLPDRTRKIIFLRKFQAIPQREVASRLGVSERTVEAQLAKGMKLCERFLRKRGVGGFRSDE